MPVGLRLALAGLACAVFYAVSDNTGNWCVRPHEGDLEGRHLLLDGTLQHQASSQQADLR
jgi:hypothetical protein